MFKLLFILFLTIPLLEIYILIQVGGFIGPLLTVALCILTAAIGAFLLRLQGLQTLIRAQDKLQQGQMPATELLGGLILLLTGLLLLTPGFFTDIIGFLCLVPALREKFAISLLNQLLQGRVDQYKQTNTVIIDADYWEEDERKRIKD